MVRRTSKRTDGRDTRRGLASSLLPLLIPLLAGCGILSPCEERAAIHEVVFGHIAEDFQRDAVQIARNDGWVCVAEPLRNAFGRQIGQRYSCSICE